MRLWVYNEEHLRECSAMLNSIILQDDAHCKMMLLIGSCGVCIFQKKKIVSSAYNFFAIINNSKQHRR